MYYILIFILMSFALIQLQILKVDETHCLNVLSGWYKTSL